MRTAQPGARPARWAWLAVCLLAAGCGGTSGVDVSGKVTFDGKPLPAGRIYFNPDFTKGNDGPQGYAEIRDGRFDTRRDGKAACGGPTVVVIQGYDGKQTGNPGSMGNRLFVEYKETVELPKKTCTQDFAVPASAADDLPKKGARPDRRP